MESEYNFEERKKAWETSLSMVVGKKTVWYRVAGFVVEIILG